MNNLTSSTIDLFKVVVATHTNEWVLANAKHGFVTNFAPTHDQLKVLKEAFKALPIVTLFSVEERNTASLEDLIHKQILHYIEVYGLEAPGLFNLEVDGGKIQTIAFVKAVTLEELGKLVQDLLYSNRPVKDSAPIIELVRDYRIPYDINEVKNNELKVALYNPYMDQFTSGDDAVRYMCYVATGNTLLIKSKAVINKIAEHKDFYGFLEAHIAPLARVFNRHKPLIMAAKNLNTRSVVNKISHLSKKLHIPVHEPVSKRFVSGFIRGEVKPSALDGISIRDKFKYLNLIEWKLKGQSYDAFLIRNGKVWFEKDRKVLDGNSLVDLDDAILDSLKKDLTPLKGKSILLDPNVQYGLPISRKQTLGNLPFGTRVKTDSPYDRFAAGIYWHNNFGDGSRIDLDLSAIDDQGERTGWGGLRAYGPTDIVFSGDVVDARNGATEFMTIDPNKRNRYGLMVNTFRGPEPCDCEVVVGTSTKKDWLDGALIRERTSLGSKMSIIGFFKDDAFIVYSGRLSNARVSDGKHPVIDKGLGGLWIVNNLLIWCGILFDTVPQPGVVYDHDLTYGKFSLDKLEKLLGV